MEDRLLIYDQREIYYTKDDGTFCRCPICGISFRKDAMKIHFSIHAKSGLIHCRECDKQHYFQDERAASVHFEYHINHLSYTCSLCGVSAQFKEHIKDHLKSHHGITYYKCSFCNKNLHSYEEAKHHMYFHHPEIRPNETVTILHDQIIRNNHNKTFLPERRAVQDLKCNPNLASRCSVYVILFGKGHIETIPPKEQLSFKSNAENPRNKTLHNGQSRSTKLMSSSIDEKHSVQSNLPWNVSSRNTQNVSSGSPVDFPNQLSLVNSKLDVPQQSTDVSSNSNISCEASSSGAQLDRQLSLITNQIQDDNMIHNAEEEESTGILEMTDIKSEFCWEDVDDLVTWSQQEENIELPREREDVVDLVGEINLRDQWHRNADSPSGEVPSVFSEFLQHYTVITDEDLECPVCEKMYNPNVLKEHFYTHDVKDLVCTKCKKAFEKSSQFYNHYLSSHSSVKPFECLSCDQSFKLKSSILGHLKTVHGIMYKCPQCNFKFKYMKGHNVRRCVSLKSKPVSSSLKNAEKRKCLRKTTRKASLKSVLSKSRQLRSSTWHSLKTRQMTSNNRKTTKKASLNSILSKSMQLRSSTMTSNTRHLVSHKKVKSEDKELMEEESTEAENGDGSFHERRKMSTRSLMAAEGQPIRKKKDVLDLTEVKMNLDNNQRQKKANAVKGGTTSSYLGFLQHYSINTKVNVNCPFCRKLFKFHALRKHMYSHAGKKPICIKCKRVFGSHKNLYNHCLSIHNSAKPFECSKCDVSFKQEKHIVCHLRNVHGIKYKCLQCNLEFKYLRDHNEETCVKIAQSRSHSVKAMEMTTNGSILGNHKKLIPEKTHLSEPISAASRRITHDDKFQERRKVLTGRRKATEEQSQLKSKDVLDLTEVKMNLDNNQRQKKANAVKGGTTSSYLGFLQHYSINTKVNVNCPFCRKLFKFHALRKHMYSHAGKKPICIKCKRVFGSHKNLYNHCLSIHNSAKPFECSKCDVSFKQEKHIVCHLRNVHGIKYKCLQCNLEFKYLRDHNEETCVKIAQSRSHSVKAMEMTTNGSILGNHKKLIPEKTHLSEPISAASRRITHDDKFQERRKVLTGRRKATEEQSQLKSKDMLDNSGNQKNDKGTPFRRAYWYSNYLQHFSVRTKKILKCPICQKICRFHTFKKHIFSHVGKKTICRKCKLPFAKRAQLYEHCVVTHNTVKPFECSMCKKSFKLRKYVFCHLRTVHGIKYKCLQCNMEFGSLKDHNARKCMHISKSLSPSVKFMETTTNASNLNNPKELASEKNHQSEPTSAASRRITNDDHFQERGKMLTRRRKATEEQYRLKSKDLHDFEEENISMDIPQESKMDTAASGDKSPSIYSNSVKHCCTENEKAAKCPICGDSHKFFTIRKHLESSHDIGTICVKCDQTFTIQHDLITHYLTCHCRVKPFKCHKCNKCFKMKTILLQHLRTEHYIKYRCPKCDLEYESLKDHDASNCNLLKLRIKLVRIDQSKLDKLKHVIKNEPAVKENMEKQCSRRFHENIRNTAKQRTVDESQTVNKKLYKKKLKKAIMKTRQRYSNKSRSFSKRLTTKKNTKQPERSCDIESRIIQFASPGSQEDELLSGSQEDKPSSGSQEDEPSSGSQEDKPSSGSQEDKPSSGSQEDESSSGSQEDELLSGSQEDESIQIISIHNNLDIHKDRTWPGIHMNKLMPAVSMETLGNDSFLKEGQMSTEFLGAADAQSHFPFPLINRKCTKEGIEPPLLTSFSGDIGSRNVHIASSENQVDKPVQIISIENHLHKQREIPWTGVHVNEWTPTVSKEMVIDDYSFKGGQMSTGISRTSDVQSQLPLRKIMCNKNDTEQMEHLSITKDIARQSLQVTPSRSQAISIDNHSYKQTEMSCTGIHTNEFMPACSFKTISDENIHNGGQITTGFLGIADTQSQYSFINTKKRTEQLKLLSSSGVIVNRNMLITSSGSQVDESIQIMSINNPIGIQKEKTWTGIHMNEQMPAVSMNTLNNDNFLRTLDAQSPLPIMNRLCTNKNTVQPELLHFQGDIGSRNLQIPSFGSQMDAPLQMVSSDNHSYKQNEITWTGIHEKELMAAVSMNTLSDNNSAERGHISTGFFETADTQPLLALKDMLDMVEGKFKVASDKRQVYSNYLQHYSVNTKKILKCPICEKICKHHTIKEHLFSHVGKTTICIKCKLLCENRSRLYEHYMNIHNSVKSFECSLCDKSFKLKKDVFCHLRKVHGIKYKCPQCNLEFSSLKDHNARTCMQIIQSENISAKALEITTNVSNLDNHMELSEPIAAASRRITHDDKFQERGKVLTGRLKATEEQSQLKSKGIHSNMVYLVETQMNPNELQSQKNCTLAPFEDISKYYSKYYSFNTKTMQKCPICCEMYAPHTIKNHLQSHGGFEPVCFLCRKFFTKRRSLQNHYLTCHSFVKPFECLICDKSFTIRRYVVKHLRTLHGIKYETRHNTKGKELNSFIAKEGHGMFTEIEKKAKVFGSGNSGEISKTVEITRDTISILMESSSSHYGVPISFRDRKEKEDQPWPCGENLASKEKGDQPWPCGENLASKEKGDQPWPCGENLASNSKPITVRDSVLEKALIVSDCNTNAYNGDLQNGLDGLRTDHLYSTDTLKSLFTDNRLDMEQIAVQYARALEQEAYFVSLWMAETDNTDTSYNS